MRTKKYYKCPVCGCSYDTNTEAIKCRNTHQAIIETWAYCSFCGGGWNVERFGVEAYDMARKCESKHRAEEKEK